MPKEVHKGKVYAVANGRSPGVYNTWEEAEAQVRGFANNRFKSFSNPNEAAAFMQGYQAATRVRASDARAVQPAGSSKARASELSRSQPYAAPAPVRPATQARPPPPSAQAPRRAPAVRTAVSQRSTSPAQETYPVAYGAPSAGHQGPRPRPQPAAHSLRLEFDGASKNNPGPSGLGAVLYDKSTGAEVSRVCRYVGTKTNNEAEYLGVIAGMQEARRLGCQSIEIRGDSQLVINQIQDNWKVKADSLRPYHQTATDLYQSFPSRTAHHIPRELNKVADKLSNEAIRNYDQNVTKDVWTLQDAHGSSSSS